MSYIINKVHYESILSNDNYKNLISNLDYLKSIICGVKKLMSKPLNLPISKIEIKNKEHLKSIIDS